MKILITGGKGQLGTEILTCLKNGKTELGGLQEILLNSKYLAIDVDELDITNLIALDNLMLQEKYDVIINCAAYSNVDGCETNQDDAFKVNAIGCRNLAIISDKYQVKLAHISTDYVFDGDAKTAYREWDICNPQNIYGKTKYLGEQYIREFSNKHFIIRTSWLYGNYGSNFVKTIMGIAKEKGELKIVDDQIGKPTNCADLAHHILKLICTEEYGTYHCAGEGECSWFDFACKVIEYSKIKCKVKPCKTNEFPRPAKRPAFSSLDNMMLRNTIGCEMRAWQDSLKYFIENLEN